MKRIAILILGLGMLSACTPADEQYCKSFGVEGTAEYGKCLDHYHQQTALFDADRSACELTADVTYPTSLYDRGHSQTIQRCNENHCHTEIVDVAPDWYKNNELNRLRMRIIEPCMQQRGWVSGSDWQAGRRPMTPVVAKPQPAAKLPWQK